MPRALSVWTRLRELASSSELVPALVRGAGAAFALQVAGFGLAYVLQVLLARWMGAAEYGTYALVIAWVTLLAVVAGLGFPVACLRFLAEYQERQDWPLLRGTLASFWGLTLGAGGLLAAAGALLLYGWPRWLGWPLPEKLATMVQPLTWGLWLVPLYALLSLQSEMARGLGWVGLSKGPQQAGRPLAVLMAAWAMLAWRGELTAGAALEATLVAVAVVVALQLVACISALPPAGRSGSLRLHLGLWLRVAVPSLLGAGFVLLMNQLDVLMVGMFLAPEKVGIYNAASRTAMLISFVVYALNVVAVPRFAPLAGQGDREPLRRLLAIVAHLGFWPTFALTLGVTLLAGPILGAFGAQFQVATWELRLLALSQLFTAAVGPVGYLLNMTGHHDDNAWALGGAVALNVVLNAAGIPLLGTRGAAAATAITWLVLGLVLHRLVRRRLGVGASIVSALACYGWRWPSPSARD